MQYACYFSSIETRLNVTDILVKICNIKFHENPSSNSRAVSFIPTSADEREEELIKVTGPNSVACLLSLWVVYLSVYCTS